MKPYLVDLPVRVQLWIRPHLLRKQFEVIKEARPSVLFLISDGGRTEKEKELISESRKIFEDIDWECTVYKLFMDENQGLYTMGKLASKLIWDKVDRIYFLEDDYIPSVDAFRFCAELLEKYKDDTRIAGICTTNLMEKWECGNSDYFFSNVCTIWGCATWKRTFMLRDNNLKYKNNRYAINCVLQNKSVWVDFKKRLVGYTKNDYFEGHVPGGEFFNTQTIYMQNQLYIFPSRNLISNMGYGDGAAHSGELKLMPRRIRKAFNIPSYNYSFPLKHPDYIMPDTKFSDSCKKILGVGHPFLKVFDRIETVFLRIIHGEFKYIFKKLKEKMFGKRKIEK